MGVNCQLRGSGKICAWFTSSFFDEPGFLAGSGRDIPVRGQLFFKTTLDVGERFRGGVTVGPEFSLSGPVEVVVDPGDIRTRATLSEAVAHKLLGEAFGRIEGVRPALSHNLGRQAEKERRRRSIMQQGPKPEH